MRQLSVGSDFGMRQDDHVTTEEDFMRLLQQHQTQILSFIYCLVHHLPDAEDVLQQTAITLWNKFDEFDREAPESSFLAWAKTVAKNKSLTFLRDQRRQRVRFSNSLVEQLAERPLWSSNENQRRLAALAHCRQKLAPNDQSLLLQCYGATTGKIQEVAANLERTVDSVYVSLSRIRKSLAECIRRTIAQEESP